MIVLDTDTLSLLFANHARVAARYRAETDDVVTTVISRIEVLQGRFSTMLKAADGAELLRGQDRLERAESDLATLRQLPISTVAAVEFDKIRGNKKLKRIGRGDLLIAAIVLANRATLATRNEKDFRQVPGLRIENWAD
jgi:tRNA(fMet)-specific endonuclease VapC